MYITKIHNFFRHIIILLHCVSIIKILYYFLLRFKCNAYQKLSIIFLQGLERVQFAERDTERRDTF